jgi:hemerythrin-like domain-containing protein
MAYQRSNEDETSSANIFDLIRGDHRKVEDLFSQIEAADDQAAATILEQLVNELVVHTRAEEETLYARLRNEDDSRDDILKSDEEHALVHQLCMELLELDEDDDRCDAKLRVLKELVEHHVEDEESQLLPMAEELIGAEGSVALGEEFLARKNALQQGDRMPEDITRAMQSGQPSH